MIIDKVSCFLRPDDKEFLKKQKSTLSPGEYYLLLNKTCEYALLDYCDSLLGDDLQRFKDIKASTEPVRVELTADGVEEPLIAYRQEFSEDGAELLQKIVDAIIADATEILNAVDKKDYLAFTRQQKQIYEQIKEGKKAPISEENYENIKANRKANYDGCFYYLGGTIYNQYRALIYYGLFITGEEIPAEEKPLVRMIQLLRNKARELYPQTQRANIQRYDPAEEELRYSSFSLPSNYAFELMGLSLIYGATDIGALNGLTDTYNRHSKIEASKNESTGRYSITYTRGDEEIALGFSSFTGFTGKNKMHSQKLFTKILEEVVRQAVINGEVIKDTISFPLEELVKPGSKFYATKKSAAAGFTKISDVLIPLSIKLARTRKNRIERMQNTSLFTQFTINKGMCYVSINPLMNWSLLLNNQYCFMPKWFYDLPDGNSTILCKLIFVRARQNTDAIAKGEPFNISLELIRSYLALQDPNSTQKHTELIKNPIEKAIEAVEATYDEYRKNNPDKYKDGTELELQLYLVADDDASIQGWLNGRLEVTLKGDYAGNIKSIASKQQQRIAAQSAKRKDKQPDQ